LFTDVEEAVDGALLSWRLEHPLEPEPAQVLAEVSVERKRERTRRE
jgi:hypothetical protein